MTERLFTTQETAEQIGVSDSAVRHWIRAGRATPHQQIGGTWMFSKEEIERLQERRRSSGRPKKEA